MGGNFHNLHKFYSNRSQLCALKKKVLPMNDTLFIIHIISCRSWFQYHDFGTSAFLTPQDLVCCLLLHKAHKISIRGSFNQTKLVWVFPLLSQECDTSCRCKSNYVWYKCKILKDLVSIVIVSVNLTASRSELRNQMILTTLRTIHDHLN